MEVQREENVRKNDFLLGLEREDYSARKRVHDEDKDVCEGEEKKIFYLALKCRIMLFVDWMKEYQQAAIVPALQCFISDLERRDETCTDISPEAKCLILCFKKKNIFLLYRMF